MKTPDKIERTGDALIQHGHLNRRVYIMKVGDADPCRLIEMTERLAVTNGYTKVFAKVPETRSSEFLRAGYAAEASIPGFFRGREKALFLCKYFLDSRRIEKQEKELDRIEALAKRQISMKRTAWGDSRFLLRPCTPHDASCMSDLYGRVFPSYPFPIDRPDYILKTMKSHSDYFGVECGRKLIALASAEMDREQENVEMTDFATLPEWEGNGLGQHLLSVMETVMTGKGIKTAYTIARAASAGINIIFSKQGYRFGGRLINNTNISGCIESMNVWYKTLYS